MDAHLGQWLNLALRWGHVITGIAWIGTSFYFNWLNSRLAPPERPEPGVDGELWSVHGGGFYRVVKYAVAPARLPRTLHWFKWEAYATWLSGVALLVLIYYLDARVYLVNPERAGLTSGAAIAPGEGPAAAFRLDDVPGVAVEFRRAEGVKCARSWKIQPDVGADPDYPDVTPRDARALREWEAARAADG